MRTLAGALCLLVPLVAARAEEARSTAPAKAGKPFVQGPSEVQVIAFFPEPVKGRSLKDAMDHQKRQETSRLNTFTRNGW